ncbi:MAG: 6-phosphofructokinase [Acidimicrobiia bacterium]
MAQSIGILTAGGDAPGLNAAIRAIGKSAIRSHGWSVVGFLDGFRGLMQDRSIRLDSEELSGILTHGGTILGTGRDKVHRMDVGGSKLDMRSAMLDTFNEHQLSALVCLGGGGTMKNALRLSDMGMPVIALPKTIDNDVWGTDRTFGFDTALTVATDAVDRLHSTAHSHHRIIVVEIMGHNAGWLTLGAGLGGGADVVLIPEIPYSLEVVAQSIANRRTAGSRFSIIAVAEGAVDQDRTARIESINVQKAVAEDDDDRKALRKKARKLFDARPTTVDIAHKLEDLTGLDARVTILGHVQRGGIPSPVDRILATCLGTAATRTIAREEFRVMVASDGDGARTIPLDEVAGRRRMVPIDHPWVASARDLGICLGDQA